MSDFVCMDWDLQAIVRGCSSELSTSVMDIPHPQSCFTPPSLQQDVFFKFPDICESTTIFDELEQLYKPFYPQTTITSTTSMSVPSEVKKPKKMRKPQPVSISANGTINTDEAAQPKKGRKNQQKRVVQQVTDALSCDMWAWRKYGQKPIKGSPYPRSYYRCSSSKGCLARKQVERSSTDPGQFIITYSAEHNHTHPIRRSSLAGSTRSKALMRSTVPAATSQPADQAQTVLSPITPLARSIEDEFVQENIKKEEGNVFENGGEEVMPDLSDELFSSLQDLEDLLFDQFTEDISDDKTWFIDESATITTQGL